MEIKNIDRIVTPACADSVKFSPKAQPKNQSVNPFQTPDNSTFPKNSPVSADAFGTKNVTPLEANDIARGAILNYFKNQFIDTPKFKEVFGNATWNDIGDTVIYRLSLQRDKAEEMKRYEGKAYLFKADMAGLQGEVAIDKKTGAVKNICIEAD